MSSLVIVQCQHQSPRPHGQSRVDRSLNTTPWSTTFKPLSYHANNNDDNNECDFECTKSTLQSAQGAAKDKKRQQLENKKKE